MRDRTEVAGHYEDALQAAASCRLHRLGQGLLARGELVHQDQCHRTDAMGRYARGAVVEQRRPVQGPSRQPVYVGRLGTGRGVAECALH